MQSSARLRLHLEGQSNELNDYEDEENEYEDYYEDEDNGNGDYEDDIEEGDDDDDESLLALQNELARAAFGDHMKGSGAGKSQPPPRRELDREEEKLLDMLQRRLFHTSASSKQDTGISSIKQQPPGLSRSSGASPAFSRKPGGAGDQQTTRRTTTISLRFAKSKQTQDQQQQQLIYSLGPAPDPSISPKKISKMVRRFRLQEEKRARKLRAKCEEAESKEKPGFTFAPALNRKSLRLTDQIPKFLDRQKKRQYLRKQQDDWYKQLQETERNRDRTLDLEAHVKTPCICSRGNTSTTSDCAVTIASSPSRLGGGQNRPPLSSTPPGQTHTRSCLRFMEMCAKMNKSFAIQRRKDQMKRSIDDMMAYHEEKKLRQQARTEIVRAQEATHTTFMPQINPKSEKIYAAMVRSGKLQSELAERMSMQHQITPTVPSLSFQPTISKRSKALLQKKKGQRSSSGTTKWAGTKGGNPDGQADGEIDEDLDDVFFRLHKQQLPRGDHQKSPSKQDTVNGTEAQTLQKTRNVWSAVEWNEIAFDHAKHGFILQNFGLKVSTV